jgi:hypothetical protein
LPVAAVRYHVDVIELVGFAADCRLRGAVDLGDRRLTDLLNATPELRLEDVRVESIDDGHVVALEELTVGRDELLAVVAGGPRGEPARRLHTHTIMVEVELGPYRVTGAVHGRPASDPLAAVFQRAAWVPLTDARIAYRSSEGLISESADTLLVNRGLAGSFQVVEEESIALPWETRRTTTAARVRTVDLAGMVQVDTRRDTREPDAAPVGEPPA